MLRKLPIVDDIALKAIRCTVNQAIRRGWFVKDEFRDLIHDIVIQLLLKKDCFGFSFGKETLRNRATQKALARITT